MSSHRLRLFGSVQLLARDGARERSMRVQPKPLALLAYPALEAGRGSVVRRDVLLARFWPELDDERARGAPDSAIAAFERAAVSRTHGFTRIAYEEASGPRRGRSLTRA